jgi:glucuronosyltransferase
LHVLKTTEDEFYITIKNLLENEKYLETAKKISKALRDTPMTPLEEATYWTEWVIRNPDIDLEGPAGDQGFIVRHSIDVIVTILAALLLVLYVLIKIGRFLIRILSFLFGRQQKNVKSDKKRN